MKQMRTYRSPPSCMYPLTRPAPVVLLGQFSRVTNVEFSDRKLSDTHIVMCKYCNIRLEGQKKDILTKHMTSASHLKKINVVYLITVGLKNSDLYFFFFFCK
jgi:hypothetical protein